MSNGFCEAYANIGTELSLTLTVKDISAAALIMKSIYKCVCGNFHQNYANTFIWTNNRIRHMTNAAPTDGEVAHRKGSLELFKTNKTGVSFVNVCNMERTISPCCMLEGLVQQGSVLTKAVACRCVCVYVFGGGGHCLYYYLFIFLLEKNRTNTPKLTQMQVLMGFF